MIALIMLPKRECHTCRRQDEFGCFARKVWNVKAGTYEWINKSRLPMELDGEEWWACPRQPIHQDASGWSTLMMYHSMYEKGHLPDSGSIVDQSNRAISLFRIIDQVISECRKELSEKEAKKSARPAPSQAGPPMAPRQSRGM